jgi:hypothetical protein
MNRDKIIPVRVTEEEFKKLEEKAKEKGLKLSTYLRFKGLE